MKEKIFDILLVTSNIVIMTISGYYEHYYFVVMCFFCNLIIVYKNNTGLDKYDKPHYMWLVRHEDGRMTLFHVKPYKCEHYWEHSGIDDMDLYDNQLPDGCNPQWTDDEPLKVKLTKA